MTVDEINAMATEVLLAHLDDNLEYCSVYDRDDCRDMPEGNMRAIHTRANELCEQLAVHVRSGGLR